MALTPKQEAFCQAYIETGNQSKAYRRAYDCSGMKPETINRNAAAMFGKNKIATRMAALQGEIKQTHNVTVASLIAELEEARIVGRERSQASAMVSATMGKAKLAGLTQSETKDAKDDVLIDPDADV